MVIFSNVKNLGFTILNPLNSVSKSEQAKSIHILMIYIHTFVSILNHSVSLFLKTQRERKDGCVSPNILMGL